MKQSPFGSAVTSVLLAIVISCPALGQAAAPAPPDQSLTDSVLELRRQVQELRAAVAEIRTEASHYRDESQQLRQELESMKAAGKATTEPPPSAEHAGGTLSLNQRVASLEESDQLAQNELRTQYQTKVESASKYRVRLSGLALFNLFGNSGAVDNIDVPTYAAPSSAYGATSSFGATLRQSQLGLEVFGPTLHGAKTSGQVQVDFGGGFPAGALDGVSTGIVRLRTASMRLDWERTSIVAGQDDLFISPNSPSSFASLITPSFGYSGNLWGWVPQLRIEHRISLSSDQDLVLQAGILDNLTSEPSYGTHRQPEAGEASAKPAYAFRTGWKGAWHSRPTGFGVSAYYSRQNWGFDWNVDGWAIATDWRVPIANQLELSGEFYRGRAIGGLGGGIGQSVIFSGSPTDPYSEFRGVDSIGGWSQLKFNATPKLEFNAVVGLDSPFSSDIHAFPAPVGPYQTVLAANRSGMANFIYRPRSDLLISGEYRHLHTSQVLGFNTADQVNLMMGVLF